MSARFPPKLIVCLDNGEEFEATAEDCTKFGARWIFERIPKWAMI